MADIIQIRRDSSADWTSVDPVLADGEWGYEQDTGKLKLGDGTTAWTSLPYLLGDVDAIHDNVASEIHAITQKTPPVANDELLIEDSAAAYAKKRVLVSEFSLSSHTHSGGVDPTAIHDNVSSEISAVTEKEALVNNDIMLIEDSEATNAKKRARFEKVWEMAPPKGGADSDAIHVDVAGEINALTDVAPATGDVLVIEDASDSWNKKKIQIDDFAASGHDHDSDYLPASIGGSPTAGHVVKLGSIAIPPPNWGLVDTGYDIGDFSMDGHTHVEADITDLTHYDDDAIHDNVDAEIDKLDLVTVASTDILLIEDASDSFGKKKIVASDFATAGHTHTYYDSAAFHDNETGEINALTSAVPASGDYLLMEDATASFAKKKLDIDELALAGHAHGGGVDPTAIHDNTANEISAITEKTTPANDDLLVIEDSAASYVKKRLKISNLPGGSGLSQAQVLARGLGA